jgi:enoyl-CoA hydratase/carnithine racemase
MGVREARRLLLTGDRMKAADARAASLVQEVVPRLALDAAVDRTVISLMKGDSATLEVTKGLALEAEGPIGPATLDRMRRLFHEGRRVDTLTVRRSGTLSS